jgi:hypothetical protein
VIDPGDESPGARVYAFDESIGEVRFGDGLHGMIPPIGRDSIVAFSYKRTEPATPGSDVVPANTITARTPLNLVTPVESVEAVVAADQAAGGAPAESVDRIVRFGFSRLRHRSRVVTARDLEDVALQSSPDIVQACAFPTRAGVKLVVVMKGRVPMPTAAQVRELRRVLLEASPVSLATPGALQIAGPAVRSLRVELTLRVESLDQAGVLAKRVKEKLGAFFDTGIGGLDGRGWQLGLNPSEEDIALALVDTEYLDGLLEIRLREVGEDGTTGPWPTALAPTQVAMLAGARAFDRWHRSGPTTTPMIPVSRWSSCWPGWPRHSRTPLATSAATSAPLSRHSWASCHAARVRRRGSSGPTRRISAAHRSRFRGMPSSVRTLRFTWPVTKR